MQRESSPKAYFFHNDEYLRFDIKEAHVDPGYPKKIAEHWNGFPTAFTKKVDAAVNWGNGKAYFFHNDEYLRYDLKEDHVDPGYPKKINTHGKWVGFPAAFTKKIDAAVNWLNGEAYFFLNDEYLRYNIQDAQVDGTYPQKIAYFWHGFPTAFAKKVDAAVEWGNAYYYFFHNDEYLRYNYRTEAVDPGYPKKINTHGKWIGFPTEFTKKIDAALGPGRLI